MARPSAKPQPSAELIYHHTALHSVSAKTLESTRCNACVSGLGKSYSSQTNHSCVISLRWFGGELDIDMEKVELNVKSWSFCPQGLKKVGTVRQCPFLSLFQTRVEERVRTDHIYCNMYVYRFYVDFLPKGLGRPGFQVPMFQVSPRKRRDVFWFCFQNSNFHPRPLTELLRSVLFSHVAGFATINAWGSLQQKVFNSSPLSALLVAALVDLTQWILQKTWHIVKERTDLTWHTHTKSAKHAASCGWHSDIV